MKRITFILTWAISISVFGQLQPVDVADLTLKIGSMGSEEMFYGFAKGDQIIFSFEELKGKELKEVEIIELPSNSKFMDYKTSRIDNKKIVVHQKSLYKFKFNNGAISGRICKVKIQRIPKNENLISFNTNWEWKTLYDTTYIPYTEDSLTGYETIKVPYTKKELVRIDTNYREIHSPESEIWIYSRGNIKACFGKSESCTKQKITLNYPTNTEKLLVWIGVGQETRDAFNKLSTGITKIAVKGGSAYLSGGSSLIVNAVSSDAVNEQIENLPRSKSVIDVYFSNQEWADYWYSDYENRINPYDGLAFKDRVNFKHTLRKNQFPKNKMILCMKNNSYNVGAPVSVGIVAVVIDKIYENKQYIREDKKPIYVTLNKKRMEIKSTKIRVNAK